MDNGQAVQTNGYSGEQDFFTAGAGTNSENLNNVEPENNLDLSSNGAASWSTGVEHDPRSIGGKAITTHEAIFTPEYVSQAANASPELGEVVNLEMPPDFVNNEPMSPPSNDAAPDITEIDFAAVRAQKDSISPETLRITQRAVSEFEKGKITPAELDDLRWETTKAYLKNSFGRDLAA